MVYVSPKELTVFNGESFGRHGKRPELSLGTRHSPYRETGRTIAGGEWVPRDHFKDIALAVRFEVMASLPKGWV